MFKKLAAIGLLAIGAPAYATTYTLDFDASVACGVTACSNGSGILQTYGDVAGQVDVVYDADRATPGLESLSYWSTGYETLNDVAYGILGGGGLSITLDALPGFQVSLLGFDIAPYFDRVRNTSLAVIDLFDNSTLFSQNFTPLSTEFVTSFALGGATSTGGFRIELGPDAWDVGIDNIIFSVSSIPVNPPPPNPAPIPLPAAGWMLLAGLGGLAAMRRRARQG